MFVRSEGSWSQEAYLKPFTADTSDRFGWGGVGVAGDTVVVGAYLEDGSATGVDGASNNAATGAGAAYLFMRSGGVWSQQAYLKASNTGGGDNFGRSVALSVDTVVVGAPLEDSNATGVDGDQSNNDVATAGAAYVFGLGPEPSNGQPSADAGADVTVPCTAGGLVTLDGSASSDPDLDDLTFTWTGPFGTATGEAPSVTLPFGTSTITLVMNDGQVDSAEATVDVTVTVGVNGLLPPLAGLTLYPAAVPLPTKAFKVGRTLPLRFQLSCGSIPLTDADVLPPTIVGFVQWVGDDMHMEFSDFDDSGLSNDDGVDFRFSDGNWVYNLSTKNGVAGVYFVTIEMPDDQSYRAGFTLRSK